MRYEQLGENWGEDEGADDITNFLYPEYQEVLEQKNYKERKISSWAVVQSEAKVKVKEEGTCSTLKDVSQAQSVKHPDASTRAIEWDNFRLKTMSIEWEGNEVMQSQGEGGDDIRTTPPVKHVSAKNLSDFEVVQEKCVSINEAKNYERNEWSEKFDTKCKKGQRVNKKAWTRLKNGLYGWRVVKEGRRRKAQALMTETSAEHGPPSVGVLKWDPVVSTDEMNSSVPRTGSEKRKDWGDINTAGKESESSEWYRDQKTSAKKTNLDL